MRILSVLLLCSAAVVGAVFIVAVAVTILIGMAGYESHGRGDTILVISVVIVAFMSILLFGAWRNRGRRR
jgi:hypothetical protein